MIKILVILLLTCNFAIAQISQQTIVDEITANLPTNNRNEISAELLRNTLNQMTSAIFQNQGLSGFTITGTPRIGQIPVATSSTTASWQNGGTGTGEIINNDGSLTITNIVNTVISLNVAHSNIWSVSQFAPTANFGTNNTQIATTAFVQQATGGGIVNSMPALTYLCNPTNMNGVPAQACMAYTVAAPLFLNTSTNTLSTTASSTSFDTFVGNLSGANVQTSGTNPPFGNEGTNTGFGSLALNALTVGSGNVGIGNGALLHLTIGVNNMAIGVNSQAANISGVGNVSMGPSTLGNLTAGQNNVAIGTSVLRLGTGSNNIGVGELALFDQTTASNNTAIGPSSGRGITTGSNNSIFGSCTGLSATLANAIVLCDGANNVRVDWANTTSATLTLAGPVVTTTNLRLGTVYSVAGTALPSCVSGLEGTWAAVSDATSPTYNGAYTGGSTVHVPVYCNGSGWVTP